MVGVLVGSNLNVRDHQENWERASNYDTKEWLSLSAGIVEHLDDQCLPELIAKALAVVVQFDYCEQFVYSNSGGPIDVYDDFVGSSAKAGLENYMSSTYVLCPFYRKFRRGMQTGVYRVIDLVSECPSEVTELGKYRISRVASEASGYLTDGWPPGRQELCIAVELPDGECLGINLARHSSKEAFSRKDVESARSVTPFISASFRRYWRHAHSEWRGHSKCLQGEAASLASYSQLTPREREVVQLLLKGHSNLSVSLLLDISVTTVKTHRKNLYAKLGIATLFDLFSLFGGPQGRITRDGLAN